MCSVCGCGEGEVRIEGARKNHEHGHDHHHHHGHGHHHDHDHAHHEHAHHDHVHGEDGALHFGKGPARAHAPGLSQARMVQIETSILARNDEYAAANRQRLAQLNVLALNLVSAPGAGKTTLLVRTIEELKKSSPPVPVAVIEGDQETANDAERIRATGVPAIQVNTGKGCHLDAHMVGHAMEHLDIAPHSILFIENVGNLVCPAAFDLGESVRVAIFSTTEGEDKPLKYPDMFASAQLVLLNKADLAEACGVSIARMREHVARVNPAAEVLALSARSGEGMEQWIGWLRRRRNELLQQRLAALERECAELRAALGEHA